MRVNVHSFVAVMCISAVACTPLTKLWNQDSASSQSSETKHQNNTADVSEPGKQPRPLVSNSFAYARYAALNLASFETNELTPFQVKETLLRSAEISGVSPTQLLESLEVGEPQSLKGEMSTSQLRYEEFKAQHRKCVLLNFSGDECCRALAWPMAVLPRFSSITQTERTRLIGRAADVLVSKRERLLLWAHDPLAEESENDDQSLYRLAGLKAWLGVCHAEVSKAPRTLTEFYKIYAPERAETAQWQTVLHAKSRAKRQPRRVYMHRDGLLSIAETLDKDCLVSETEVIMRRADGTLNYWVYDANGLLTPESHFPMAAGGTQFVTSVKLAPDSCMGCHYDFVTRQFDQLKVSADLLRLPKTTDLPLRCVQSGDSIAADN